MQEGAQVVMSTRKGLSALKTTSLTLTDLFMVEQNREDFMAFVEVERDLRLVQKESSRISREENPHKGGEESERRGRSQQVTRAVFIRGSGGTRRRPRPQEGAGAGCARLLRAVGERQLR